MELENLSAICDAYQIPLFLDGARLGYGLAASDTDVTLSDIARCCHVFYIGGTKVGALCGEAVVFTRHNTPKYFLTRIKQHGALLAKGRLLGIQFDTLFTDNLYFEIGKHAIAMAELLKKGLEPDFETARKNLKDLIGIRVVCPFEDELYQVAESLEMQKDIEIVRIKDYIKNPKKNGYKSLHLIVKVPIYSAEGEQKELVEIQLRTIAMDYWSVLEYELYYKKRDNAEIETELKKYAEEIANLDHRMLGLRNKIEKI